MRRLILAAVLLLGVTSMASAEYIVIIVNLGGAGTSTTPAPRPGPFPGAGGAQVGFPFPGQGGAQAGFPFPGQGGAQAGFPFPGQGGAQAGFPPQGGAQAGFPFPPQGGAQAGMPKLQGGAQAGFPFPPQGGAQAGFPFPPQGGAQAGFPFPPQGGAQAGFPFPPQGGAQVGLPPVAPAPPPEPDMDTDKRLVVVVLEVEPLTPDYLSKFEGKVTKWAKRPPMPIRVRHKWGVVDIAKGDSATTEVMFLKADGKPLATVATRFKQRYADALKAEGAAQSEELRQVAFWALEHGLVARCAEVMDKLTEKDKTSPAARAYLEVKAALARVPAGNGKAEWVRNKLLKGARISTTNKHHYALVYQFAGEGGDVKEQLDRLEDSYRGLFYWWALRGVALKVPADRQVAILTDRRSDLARLKKHVGTSPKLADGFFARREALPILSAGRTDDPYVALSGLSRHLWEAGFDRAAVLTGAPGAGIPKKESELTAKGVRLRALLLKALEEEWEATGISHETARQLLFSTGMLPPNVSVPEWIQSGMGSFFEVPFQSPWPGIGSRSTYWLPRAQELIEKRQLGSTDTETLLKVVTDGYFRKATAKGATAADLRKARATAWSLAYYLARERLPELQNYFKELSKMPRDIELDDRVYLLCFARAFGCVGPDKSVNMAKLNELATNWLSYTRALRLDAPSLHKDIREVYAKMGQSGRGRPAGPPAGPPGVGPRPPFGGPGGFPPRGGPGGFIPGGGARPGGG